MKGPSVLLLTAALWSCQAAVSAQAGGEVPSLPPGRVVIKKTAGLPITGTAYGRGATAVILASQGGMGESEWGGFATYLADNGFTVLAISSPDSQGDTLLRVGQAIDFLRRSGFKKIVCGGVSNGASGSAFSAGEEGLTGLLLVTYHTSANLSQVALPKLFVVGEKADPWRAMTEAGFKAAAEPKSLILVPGASGTGPYIIDADPVVKRRVLEFLKACNGLD